MDNKPHKIAMGTFSLEGTIISNHASRDFFFTF